MSSDTGNTSGLGKNDPYRNMRRAQDDMRPEFLNGVRGKDSNGKVKESNTGRDGADELNKAEDEATKSGLGSRISDARRAERAPTGLFTGKGKMPFTGKKGKFKVAKASAAIIIVFGLVMIVAAVAMIGGPIFMIGNLDYNMQDALGFTGTVGILEKQAEHILSNKMAIGEMPDELAADLAGHGLTVGQVTANGDFVRTNVYVANAEDLKDMAVLGNFQANPSTGELAMLYDNKIITADEFVAAVESDPKMYAAYSEALDISAKYYYSDEVNSVYEEMGISRGAFADWVDSGDEEKNKEQFDEMVKEVLNNKSSLDVNGAGVDYSKDDNGNGVIDDWERHTTTFTENISGKGSASQIIDSVASQTKDYSKPGATEKATELLNSAISAGEPYLAASAFMAIEEPIQRARIDGDGPVNELMNMLNEETEVSYRDVSTGETKSFKKSILTTENFVAAVSAGKYSNKESLNFSRDRINTTMQMVTSGVIQDTVISTNGQKESNVALKTWLGYSADAGAMGVLNDSVDIAVVKDNNDLMRSIVGGNRAVEGGAFLSNTINTRVIGAMPSDASKIASYHREVKEVLARKAEAERATKSPFDISSPYTFMGSMVRSMANAMIRNGVGTGNAGGSIVGTMASLTSDSTKGIWNNVVADGKDDSYEVTFGDNCDTVKGVSVEGDIYCTAHVTASTDYMDKTEAEWERELKAEGSLDENGEIVTNGPLGEFALGGASRRSTVGIRNAEICEAYSKAHANFLQRILAVIAGAFGIYDACSPIFTPYEVANGAKYTFGSGNGGFPAEYYGGYMLFDEVSSLLENSTSTASRFREKYHKEHPLDNSAAGRIARISGMTKAEAQIALNYADYLTVIANYNPAARHLFGSILTLSEPEVEPIVKHANQITVELYAMWHGRTEYDDLRGRTQVV